MNKYSELIYIGVIMWNSGCSRTVAERELRQLRKEGRTEYLNLLAEGYTDQCHRAFYED